MNNLFPFLVLYCSNFADARIIVQSVESSKRVFEHEQIPVHDAVNMQNRDPEEYREPYEEKELNDSGWERFLDEATVSPDVSYSLASPAPTEESTLDPSSLSSISEEIILILEDPDLGISTTTTPSVFPSGSPAPSEASSHPTITTPEPSTLPTEGPSFQPTISPSQRPSQNPTPPPSSSPSKNPSASPSVAPSRSPSQMPSVAHSAFPSSNPTTSPSVIPSDSPTSGPTVVHSVGPSAGPSMSPSISPSVAHSLGPSAGPSATPSLAPSESPTNIPTSAHSRGPSVSPSMAPSRPPSSKPSVVPSAVPSASPSAGPSGTPSRLPTAVPSVAHSLVPSATPSARPSASPSRFPTQMPSVTASSLPSVLPSAAPSSSPSRTPTSSPSANPSSFPSTSPSKSPSASPSRLPTASPSSSPTSIPSALPSSAPTKVASMSPTEQPSSMLSESPSVSPSTAPTLSPSSSPSDQPSESLSRSPSDFPSATPTSFPSISVKPSVAPSMLPSGNPTNVPTASAKEFSIVDSIAINTGSDNTMDDETVKIYEENAKNFIVDNLPPNDKVEITIKSVEVVSQSYPSQRRQRKLQNGDLIVEMIIKGEILPGNPPEEFSIANAIMNGFENNLDDFMDILADSTSLFVDDSVIGGVESDASRNSPKKENNNFNTMIFIAGAVAGGVIAVVASVFAVRHIRSHNGDLRDIENNRSGGSSISERVKEIMVPSRSMSSEKSKGGVESGDNDSTWTYFEEDSKFMSAPTPNNAEENNPTRVLSPIEEGRQSRMDECSDMPPDTKESVTNHATPRGTPFLQLDTTSTIVYNAWKSITPANKKKKNKKKKKKISVVDSLLAENLSDDHAPYRTSEATPSTPRTTASGTSASSPVIRTFPSDVTTPTMSNFETSSMIRTFPSDVTTPRAGNGDRKSPYNNKGKKSLSPSSSTIRTFPSDITTPRAGNGDSKSQFFGKGKRVSSPTAYRSPDDVGDRYQVKSYPSQDSASSNSGTIGVAPDGFKNTTTQDSLQYSMSEDSTNVKIHDTWDRTVQKVNKMVKTCQSPSGKSENLYYPDTIGF